MASNIDIGELIVYAALILTFIYGYAMNIINLISGDVYTSLSTIIIGAVGVIVGPVGALVHFIAG